MAQIIDEIHRLQKQYNEVISEHLAEHDKCEEYYQHKNRMGQQISLDRKEELGILEIELQRQIAELTSALLRESST